MGNIYYTIHPDSTVSIYSKSGSYKSEVIDTNKLLPNVDLNKKYTRKEINQIISKIILEDNFHGKYKSIEYIFVKHEIVNDYENQFYHSMINLKSE